MLLQIVSEAAMRLPEEVYRAGAGGAPRAEEELTHEERRRRRAQHKRAFRAKTQQQVRREVQQGSMHGRFWAEHSWLVPAHGHRHVALTDYRRPNGHRCALGPRP